MVKQILSQLVFVATWQAGKSIDHHRPRFGNVQQAMFDELQEGTWTILLTVFV
jgi:hypothetical protein